MRSKIQDALLSALEAILRPIVKLMLQSGISYSEFAAIAKMAASVDTLDGFLREMKTRFPESSAKAILPGASADPMPIGSLKPQPVVNVRKIEMTR